MFKYLILFLISVSFLNRVKGASLRIIGGDEAPAEFGRYHASLQNLTGHHVCGGAVLSDTSVVTAAHCIYGAVPDYIKVVAGTTDLLYRSKQYDVSSITFHPDFNFTDRTNDIAILHVTEAFEESIDILKLDADELQEGETILLTGFGSITVDSESSHTLHKLTMHVFDQDTCQYAMRYTRQVRDSMFCTFSRIGEGTCYGDSGSPLLKNDKLVGLVSWGIPCAVGFPDVHTRISHYIEWIQQNL